MAETENFDFLDQLCPNRVFPVESKKLNFFIGFWMFKLVQISSFSLNWRFWVFNLPGKSTSDQKQKSEHQHWILYILIISLGTKFQLKMKILNFWTKFTQSVFLVGNKKSELYHWILHIWIGLFLYVELVDFKILFIKWVILTSYWNVFDPSLES